MIRGQQKAESVSKESRDELLDLPHVIGHGVGLEKVSGKETGRATILVFVDEKVDASELADEDTIPNEIEGVPTDVQVRDTPEGLRRQDQHRPAAGGVGVTGADGGSGTFTGTIVDADGEKVGVTARHVACNENGSSGDPIDQPDGSQIGTIKDLGQLDSDKYDGNIDVATFSPTNTSDISSRMFALADMEAAIQAEIGEWYVEGGKTTGFYGFRVTALDVTTTVTYSGYGGDVGSSVTHNNLIETTNFGGDFAGNSGALLGELSHDGSTFKPVGIHTAGGESAHYFVSCRDIEDRFSAVDRFKPSNDFSQPDVHDSDTYAGNFEAAVFDVEYLGEQNQYRLHCIYANVGGNQHTSDTLELLDSSGDVIASTDYTATSLESGTHTFTISDIYDSETLTISTTDRSHPVRIEQSPEFSVTDFQADSQVAQGNTAIAKVSLENTSRVEGEQDITLTVDGTEVDRKTFSLASGETGSVNLEWDTEGYSTGTYTVTGQSYEESSTSSVEVVEGADTTAGDPGEFGSTSFGTTAFGSGGVEGLAVILTDDNSPVEEGETLTVDADIENTSNEERTQLIELQVE